MHRYGPIGDAIDAALIYAAVLVMVVALATVCGCSASISWTIGPATSAGTTASGEHLDPEAIEALGGAAGTAVRSAVRP